MILLMSVITMKLCLYVCKMMPKQNIQIEPCAFGWIERSEKSELYGDAKEGETYYRFNVHLQGEYGDQDTTEFNKDFETLEEVLKFVKDYFEFNEAKWTPLCEEWGKWINKQDNIDDKEADAKGLSLATL